VEVNKVHASGTEQGKRSIELMERSIELVERAGAVLASDEKLPSTDDPTKIVICMDSSLGTITAEEYARAKEFSRRKK
jgi:hypothetical protein